MMSRMKNISNGDDLREILKGIMKERKLTINSWSKLAGTSEGTMRFFLNGTNNSLKVSTLSRYLKAIGLNIKDVGNKEDKRIIVTGHVNEGAEVIFLDGIIENNVEIPITMHMSMPIEEISALKVMDNYLLPLIQKDWIIYYHAKNDIKKCLRKLCVITTLDNRMYIKELDSGTKSQHFTLRGFNSAPVENVKIISAFPIVSIEPN